MLISIVAELIYIPTNSFFLPLTPTPSLPALTVFLMIFLLPGVRWNLSVILSCFFSC
jgi:hypothetical protein